MNLHIYKIRISTNPMCIVGTLLVILTIFAFISQLPEKSLLSNEGNGIALWNEQDDKPNVKENTKVNDTAHQDESAVKNRNIWNHPPPGTQMGNLQIAAIQKVITPNSNLLVWGLGNDSPFWHDTTQGKVIFIEPAGFWYKKIIDSYPYLEAYTVKYSTETVASFGKYIDNPSIWSELDIRSQLPPVVIETYWNVIIVDAPPGYRGAPGRYQSIYTSSLLAKNGTHIFVDDYERKVEKQFSNKMLGTPIAVVKRAPKGVIGANEQAHFIMS